MEVVTVLYVWEGLHFDTYGACSPLDIPLWFVCEDLVDQGGKHYLQLAGEGAFLGLSTCFLKSKQNPAPLLTEVIACEY